MSGIINSGSGNRLMGELLESLNDYVADNMGKELGYGVGEFVGNGRKVGLVEGFRISMKLNPDLTGDKNRHRLSGYLNVNDITYHLCAEIRLVQQFKNQLASWCECPQLVKLEDARLWVPIPHGDENLALIFSQIDKTKYTQEIVNQQNRLTRIQFDNAMTNLGQAVLRKAELRGGAFLDDCDIES